MSSLIMPLHVGEDARTQVGGGPDVNGKGVVPFGQAGCFQRLPHGIPGVVEVIDAPTLTKLDTVWTAPGAHTIAWEPDRRTLYAFLPERCGVLALSEQ